MKLISEITVRLIDQMGNDESIACAAWVKEREATTVAVTNVINFMMQHRHGTPFEHSAVTVYVHAPIFVFREWHRHRIGQSYNEESARYQMLEPTFWIPERNRRMCAVDGWKPGKPKFETCDEYVKRHCPGIDDPQVKALADKMYNAEIDGDVATYTLAYAEYERSISRGIAMEVARCKLPVGIYSSMYCTMNPRSLMAFLSLRTGRDDALFRSYPQREIEIAAEQCESILERFWPITHAAFVKNKRVAP